MNKEYQNNQLVQELQVVRRVILIETRHPTHESKPAQQAEDPTPARESTREKNVFPCPTSAKVGGNHFFCTSDRIISLYNKENRESRKKMTSAIRAWFKQKALAEGWIEAIFLHDTHTARFAGCMLRAALVGGVTNAAPH
jgi:hypothetical protein